MRRKHTPENSKPLSVEQVRRKVANPMRDQMADSLEAACSI
jgi:hypothetical protein